MKFYTTIISVLFIFFMQAAPVIGDPWVDEVVEFTQPSGSSNEGGDASCALGANDSGSWGGFVSIDTPEILILAFTDNIASDGDGDDIYVYNYWSGDSNVKIYISPDNINYVYVGMTSGDMSIDINDYGLSYVKYIKFEGQDDGGQYAGYDLDAVEAIDTTTPAAAVLTLSKGPGNPQDLTVHPEGEPFTVVHLKLSLDENASDDVVISNMNFTILF